MKITDVSVTIFSWENIPNVAYGAQTARPTGTSDLGLLAIETDQGIVGHAFLGSSYNPASMDGPALIRFLKPILMGADPLQRERLYQALWRRTRFASVRAIGAVDIALWDMTSYEWIPTNRVNLLNNWVYNATGRSCHTVLCDGKVIMEDQKILNVDENEIRNKAQEYYDQYYSQAKWISDPEVWELKWVRE